MALLCSPWEDLVVQSSPAGGFSAVPLTDAFGDSVAERVQPTTETER